ncbi:unnamed protein product [Allacma fusca]|uniref:Uncharacterized protein n=1 Tax=Allacma fusca TaxID=39272 RepID=A0A8J2P9U2_9HEXA|nr:unnamed protein product [Allacma fusca]
MSEETQKIPNFGPNSTAMTLSFPSEVETKQGYEGLSHSIVLGSVIFAGFLTLVNFLVYMAVDWYLIRTMYETKDKNRSYVRASPNFKNLRTSTGGFFRLSDNSLSAREELAAKVTYAVGGPGMQSLDKK